MEATDELATIFCNRTNDVNVCSGLLPFYCCSKANQKSAKEICCFNCNYFFDNALLYAEKAKSNDEKCIHLLENAP